MPTPSEMTNPEIHAELAKYGFKAVPVDDADAIADLAKLFRMQAAEQMERLAALSTQLQPLAKLEALMKQHAEAIYVHERQMNAHAAKIDAYDKMIPAREAQLEKIDHRLDGHDERHTQHDDHITGVIQRLVVVEKIVTKRAPAKVARRKKGKRK